MKGTPSRAASLAVGLGLSAAALVYDPHAYADEPKRVLLLGVALVGLAVVAVHVVRAPLPAQRVPTGATRFVALGWLACVGVAALRGTGEGRLELGTWVGACGAAVVSGHLGRAEAVRTARRVSLLVGVLASLWATFALARGARGFALHGGQGNPNWLGLLLAVCLPLSVEALLAWGWRQGRRRRLALLVAAVVLLEGLGLVLSHSRVAWCASAVGTVVAVVGKGSPVPRARRPLALAAVGIVLAATVTASTLSRSEPLSDDAPASVSARGRLHIWRCSIGAARSALPFGAGLGRFGERFLDAQGDLLGVLSPAAAARRFVNATTAHDDPLDLAVEAGPVAAGLLLASLLLAFRDARRARWVAGAATLATFGITALGDSPLRQPAVVIVVALVVSGLPPRRAAAVSRGTLLAATLALFALDAALLATATRAWLGTRVRSEALQQVGPDRIMLLERSVAIDPAAGETLLDLGLAELGSSDPAAALVDIDRSRKMLADVGADVARGQAQIALDDLPQAEASFRFALGRDPGSLRARVGLAETLQQQHRFDDAEREVSTAHALAPGDPLIGDLLDRIREARMDDGDDAK